MFDSIIEASAVQANPFVLRYLHDFRLAFKDSGFVYFLFSRTLGVQDNKNFTFIARMCENDPGYFSYAELQLNCSRGDNKFNKVQVSPSDRQTLLQIIRLFFRTSNPQDLLLFPLQAAYVTTPGKALAQNLTSSQQFGDVSSTDQVLFVTFTSDEFPSTSALCK